MKSMLRYEALCRVVSLCGLLCAAGCGATGESTASRENSAPADFIQRVTEKGPVRLTIRISPPEPRLSDLIHMDIEVEAPADISVKPPVFGTAVGDFLVRDYSERSPTATPNGDVRTRTFRYQLEPVQSGPHIIRSIAIEFVDQGEGAAKKDQTSSIDSDPIEINVTTELQEGVPDLANLEPMLPPQPIDRAFRLWWMALVIPSLVALAFLVRYVRRRKGLLKVELKKSAEEIAQEALTQLLSEELPRKGLMTEFYVRLTGIVRVYIEATTGLKAPEQTTEEFLRTLHNSDIFGPDRAARLQEFLEAADLVKYAGQQPEAAQIDLSIQRAKEFIASRATADQEV